MELLSIKKAAEWASVHNKRNVTTSNISYLINYGLITKHPDNFVDKDELITYYKSREKIKVSGGSGGDPELAFDNLKESETTKHVHRLHPYKGKFIPQLVQHFAKQYFSKGNVVLDPFLGSGTTLVQLAEMGIHGIGVDISEFNTIIGEVKFSTSADHINLLDDSVQEITKKLLAFKDGGKRFEALDTHIKKFNGEFFPSPAFKVALKKGNYIEKEYGPQKQNEFRELHKDILNCESKPSTTFMEKWYTKPILNEINYLLSLIDACDDSVKNTLRVILSRTVRSCRSTSHNNLSTLGDVVLCPYYCRKHKKICRPIYSLTTWWKRYSQDTIDRLYEFSKLRKPETYSVCLNGNSATIDLLKALENKNSDLLEIAKGGLDGLFTSPPYVGLIDYHEQHAYSYEMFGITRHDDEEIGSMSKRGGKKAVEQYVLDMTKVFLNAKKFMKPDAKIFVVVNDDRKLYPTIFNQSGLILVKESVRLVSNRTESTKPYFETIYQTSVT